MKGTVGKRALRALSLVGVAALGYAVVSCGDDKSNPEAVTIKELKSATGLRITDMGNGNVRLSWNGSNNEKDFSGYNVYGAKVTAAMDSKPIELLDDKGNVVEAGRAKLKEMSYNGTDWETVGEAKSDDEDNEYGFVPYYTAKDAEENPLYPTCQPSGAADANFGLKCETMTSETVPATKLNGSTYLDLAGLKVGSTYCFTVLSTLDEGQKAAAATSEVQCVTPRAMVADQTLTTQCKDGPTSTNKYSRRIDVKALRDACIGGTCGTPTTTEAASDCNATATGLCLEVFRDVNNANAPVAYLTATSNVAVQDLGYYTGFSDKNLPKAPRLDAVGAVLSKDGYTTAAQSILLLPDHVYAVADMEGDARYYHLVHVKSVTMAATCGASDTSVVTSWMLSTAAGSR